EVRPEVIEDVQGLASSEAEFRVIALRLELGDDDERDDDMVFGEAQKSARIREQHRCVENVGMDIFSHEDLCGVSSAEIRFRHPPISGWCRPTTANLTRFGSGFGTGTRVRESRDHELALIARWLTTSRQETVRNAPGAGSREAICRTGAVAARSRGRRGGSPCGGNPANRLRRSRTRNRRSATSGTPTAAALRRSG